MELGQPPPVWQWAVVSGETQVLNSNSKTGVQDPLAERYRTKLALNQHDETEKTEVECNGRGDRLKSVF